MTEGQAPRDGRSGILGWVGWILTVGLLGYASLLHKGIGPIPGTLESNWYNPSPFLLNALQGSSLAGATESAAAAVALLALPALAVAVAVFLTTRSSVARTLSTASVIAAAIFVYYGVQAPGVWTFFHWRWSGCMVLFALCLAVALCAPLLVEQWRRLAWPLRIAIYLPLFAAAVIFERNVTGTDDTLTFAISPWPVVQVFGFEVFASAVSLLLVGSALGMWLVGVGRKRGARDAVALGAVAAVAAAAIPTLAFWVGSSQGLLPFHAGRELLLVTAGIALVTLAATANVGVRHAPARVARRAHIWALGGLLLGAPLLVGQAMTRVDYSITRDTLAQRVIDALQRHYQRESLYPESLEELVAAGDLEEVPRPQIGFLSEQQFLYQSFGTSYVLEFSAPRWIQCAYNPPYEDEYEDEEEEEELEDLGGAWSCPSKPPELW